MRIVKSLCILVLFVVPAWAEKPVQVVIGGTVYASMDDYRAARLAAKLKAGQRFKPEVLRGGVKGFKIIRAVPPPQASISPYTAQALRKAGLEDGIRQVHVDFKQNWNNHVAHFVIRQADLEDNLRAVAEGRKEPILIMSRRNKLRVMALEKDHIQPKNLPNP